MKVIIVGAGLSGLSIAQGLEKNGIEYVIVEKESHPRERNWGVTMSWGLEHLANLLPADLFNRLSECSPDPSLDLKAAGKECIMIRNGQTGATIVEVPFEGIRRLNVQKTRRLLMEGLDVQFGKGLKDITFDEDKVIAHFDDGSSETADVLVGADGSGSWVRSWLLKEKATPVLLPFTFVNFMARYPADKVLLLDKLIHPTVDVGIHPKSMYMALMLNDKPDVEKPESWTFYILATWPRGEGEDHADEHKNMLEVLREKTKDWADPYKSAVELLPNDVTAKSLPLKIWAPSERWNNHIGMITLAGDAAHTMTYHRGQGANNAFCDSDRFVSSILEVCSGKATLADAMREYEEDVVTRGSREVKVSRIQTELFHDFNNFFSSPVMRHGIRPT